MPRLEKRRPLTNEQMLRITREVLTPRFGATATLHFAITCDVDPTVLVWSRGAFGLAPNPCIGKIGEYIPDAVVCPWCRKDLLGKPHEMQCDRPHHVWEQEECQPDYR